MKHFDPRITFFALTAILGVWGCGGQSNEPAPEIPIQVDTPSQVTSTEPSVAEPAPSTTNPPTDQIMAAPAYSSSGPILIQDVAVIDGLGNRRRDGVDILIEGERIVAMGELSPSENIVLIDGSKLTVMPGLVDLHVHVGGLLNFDGFKRLPRQKTLDALLYAGVTTALDLGSPHDHIVAARDAIDQGELRGPRLVITGDTVQRPEQSAKRHGRDFAREFKRKSPRCWTNGKMPGWTSSKSMLACQIGARDIWFPRPINAT